jgi:hypothetical protein
MAHLSGKLDTESRTMRGVLVGGVKLDLMIDYGCPVEYWSLLWSVAVQIRRDRALSQIVECRQVSVDVSMQVPNS